MSIVDELRSASLSLRRHPALTAVVTGALALGLAAATALFALLDAALFRPLPGRDPERLVRLLAAPEPGEFAPSFSNPMLRHFRERSRTLAGVAAFSLGHSVDLAVAGRAVGRVQGSVVSGELFPLLGVEPQVGRLLSPADEREGARVAVLSHGLWAGAFGSDPAVVGRRVELNRQPFVIVGVAPSELVGPAYDSTSDLWLPLSAVTQVSPRMAELGPLDNAGWYWLGAVARLAPGASAESASAELRALTASWNATQPREDAYPPTVAAPAGAARFHPNDLPRVRRVGAALAAAVGLVLTLACAVAATLLLVHGARRQRDLAVRMAIGARRGRIARTLLLEALLLAALALALALPLALALHRAVAALMPADFPLASVAALPLLSSRVLLFGALAALGTVTLFGLLPALRAARSQPSPVLRGGGRGMVRGRLPGGGAVLVLQIALTVAVLASAGLLLRTLRHAGGVPTGFPVEGAVVATFDLSTQGYDRERGTALYADLEEELRELPGVTAAGLARQVPVRAGGMLSTVAPEGYRPAPDENLRAELNVVSPGFFAALGVPVRGRAFTAADGAGAPRVAIVNRAFAERYWPGREAVGRRIGGMGEEVMAEVVGVVADYQTQTLREAQGPVIFLPIAQSYVPGATLVVRGAGEQALLPRVRQVMERLDPRLPLYDAGTLEERLRGSLGQERALAVVLTALGSVALLLALLGLGSSLAYATETRTREMGLRLAVGARGRQVAWLVVRQALAIAAAGCALGALLAAWVARTLEGLLFGVGTRDPSTLAAVSALLLATSVIAAWLPARRAARLDPMLILREG